MAEQPSLPKSRSDRRLHLLYVCKAVDDANPYLATQVSWIRTLAAHPEVARVTVITPSLGAADLPANVDVRAIRPGATPVVLARFVSAAIRAQRGRPDVFLVSQGGPWPALLYPIKVVRRRRLYQWKAHPHITWRMRLAADLCDDVVFTATPDSFPWRSPKVRVVGHGIDTERFSPGGEPSRDLVVVGRIARVKRLDALVAAMSECRRMFGHGSLDIVGSGGGGGAHDELRTQIERLGMQDHVTLQGPVAFADMPDVLRRYRAAVCFSDTALDKAAVEAMAVGLPVVTTNRCVAEILPPDLRSLLVADRYDRDAQARLLHDAITMGAEERLEVGRRLREIAVRDHDVRRQCARVVASIRGDLGLDSDSAKEGIEA